MLGKRVVIVAGGQSALSITSQLALLNYQAVGNFQTATEMFAHLSELKPDLVLMDVLLEDKMSGLDAAETLLQQYDIPVVFLSRYEDELLFQRAMQLGIHHYLVHPIKPRELESALTSTLTLRDSHGQIKQLLAENKSLANGLSQEINRLTTFITAATQVRNMDRQVLAGEFTEWGEIYDIYLSGIQRITHSSYAALGYYNSRGELLEMIASSDDPLHESLLRQLQQHTWLSDVVAINDQAELKALGEWSNGDPISGLLCQKILVPETEDCIFYLANKPPNSEFSDLDVEIVNLYANELVKIVSRQRLLNSLMDKNQQLEANEKRLVNQHSLLAGLMGSEMHSCGELREEILHVTTLIGVNLRIDQVKVWMFSRQSGLVEKCWNYIREDDEAYFQGEMSGASFPKGVSSTLFDKVLAVNDVLASDELAPELLDYGYTHNIRAMMFVPIWKQGQTVGVIGMSQMDTPREWQVDEQYFVTALSDIISNHMLQCERAQVQHELEQSLAQLQDAQQQLLQSEKMAAIGQLAAGVAHEINNPVGYINSNICSLSNYIGTIFQMLDHYQLYSKQLPEVQQVALRESEKKHEIGYLRDDIQELINESLEGINCVKRIVKGLKDFSHADDGEWQDADLHQGIDSTINMVWNELKYKAEVVKKYAELPLIYCIPSQLNQVFMNMLVNAAHAIAERGVITIETGVNDDSQVWVMFSDTGSGISQQNINRIFDPFFTTKPVGKGTGLGLSLSFSIIERHNGRIDINSELGTGTSFIIYLPIKKETKGDIDE